MDNTPITYDVTTDDFNRNVIEASAKAVVVVDFWAEWCAPCRMLGPVLEGVVASFNGRVILAKVDVDKNPDLARQFSIQSIPAVKLFKNGEVVDEFVGVLSEPQIRMLLDVHAGNETTDALELAESMEADGRHEDAEKIYDGILAGSPTHALARIGKARVHIARGDLDLSREILSGIDELEKEHDEALALLQSIEFQQVCEYNGTVGEMQAMVEKHPDDLDARYRLGCCFAAGREYESALQAFLHVVKKNPGWNDGKARDAMVSIFTMLGHESELTRTYRSKLAQALF